MQGLIDTEQYGTVGSRPEEGWDPTSVKTDRAFPAIDLAHCIFHALLNTHLVTLCLHFCLDSIEGVSNQCIGASIKESTEGCAYHFLLP